VRKTHADSLARIKVERDGHVILDGSSATLPRLKKALLALVKSEGAGSLLPGGLAQRGLRGGLESLVGRDGQRIAGGPVRRRGLPRGDRFADSPRDEKERDDTWW